MSAHPGFIVYVRPDETEEKKPVSAVPQSLRFAPGADGVEVPVVKVVATRRGETLTIREYGPEGQLLRSTLGG